MMHPPVDPFSDRLFSGEFRSESMAGQATPWALAHAKSPPPRAQLHTAAGATCCDVLRRLLVPGDFRLVQLELFGERFRDRRALLHPLELVLPRRIFREVA